MTSSNMNEDPSTRERILVEASRLLSLHGYRGTTTREIAAAVGISQPSLFFHFPTKRAIVEELYRLDLVPALDGLERLIAGKGSPAAKLYAMVSGEVRRVLESPYDMRAYVSFEALNDPDLEPFRVLLRQFDDRTAELIAAGQESGQFIEGDPWLALQMVSGFLARANLYLTLDQGRRPFDPEQSATMLLRALLTRTDVVDEVKREAAPLEEEYLALR